MSYVRNESEDASLTGGATILQASDSDQLATAADASQHKYLALPGVGAVLEWSI
jgi:hypothetical protein